MLIDARPLRISDLIGAVLSTNLLEVTRGLRRATVLTPIEKKATREIQKAFRVYQKSFMKGLNDSNIKANYFKEALDDDLDPIFTKAELDSFKLFEKTFVDTAAAGLKAGYEQAVADLALQLSFSLKNPRAVAYIGEHGAKMVSKVDDTTKAIIRDLIKNGADQGLSYNELARQLNERFKEFQIGKPQLHIDSRAHLIAVTELGNAYVTGNYIVGQDLRSSGIPMEKKWSTMGDTRVSPGCQVNGGTEWIDYDKEFPSGHLHPLRFPGCRCDIEIRVAPGYTKPVGTAEVPAGPAPLEGFGWKYGINPAWTPEQRNQFIDQNMNFNLRKGAGVRAVKDLADPDYVAARAEALRLLGEQPDTVVSSFLKRGEILYADDLAFRKLYGEAGFHSNIYAFFDIPKDRMVFQFSGLGDAYQRESFVHEMGHYIHSNSGVTGSAFSMRWDQNIAFDRFTNYAKTNKWEGFAESYVAWYNNQVQQIQLAGKWKPIKMADPDVAFVFKLIGIAVDKVRK